MTIKYLDSKRIVKLSTDTVQTLSYENTSAVSIGTGDSGTSVDLTGSTLSNSWVLRFKLTMASKANNLIFMVQDINTIDETTTRDGIGLRQTASTSYYDFEGCNGTAPTGGQYDHRFTTVPAIDTKYIQVTRISETSAKIEFCDSSYTVLESSGNITIADITNLRYFVIYNNGSALTVDDIDFWNEVSSITTKPTNVQDNSILVEKDTGERYWRTPESTSDVTWDSATIVGYTVSGNTITDSVGGWGSKARSVSTFTDSTGGTINYQTGSNTHYHYLGIGKDPFGNYASIDFALYATNSGNLQPVEFDVSTNGNTNVGTYTSSDTISMSLDSNGAVTAFKNGSVIYTFPTTASGTYYAHVASYPSGASVSATITTPATWTWENYYAFRGIFCGGGTSKIMDYISIATLGNATDFGDLLVDIDIMAGVSSETRGVIGGGSPPTNVMQYITISTLGNATDFGDLTVARNNLAGASNLTRGIFAGGDTGSDSNVIDYITISTLGNATDFGDLTRSNRAVTGLGNATRGVFAGGALTTNVMDYVTIASAGNATDFGDLTAARRSCASAASSTRGVFAGGSTGSNSNVIDYITIATTGNATDFGDLTVARQQLSGVTSDTRGCFGGGSAVNDTIDYITIATTGNATDFGNLTVGRTALSSSGLWG